MFLCALLRRRGKARPQPQLLHNGAELVVARALEFLLLYLLLDEESRVADGGLGAADGDDAVARARRERSLLGDLDVGARHLLDLHQAAPARTYNVRIICYGRGLGVRVKWAECATLAPLMSRILTMEF